MRVFAEDRAGNYVTLTYFNNPGWAKKQLPLGETRIVSGKLDRYGQELQIVHPDHVVAPAEAATIPAREAVYPLSEGITSHRLADLAGQAMARAPELAEWIEPTLKARRGWPGWSEALATIHDDPTVEKARERLAYDEIFANQLALALVRASSRKRRGLPLAGDGSLRDKLRLPYVATDAQRRAIGEIEADLAQDAPMLRLLQGDVGSGKTLVALMAMLVAVEAGAQAALLAPTEILARQHHDNLSRLLAGLPVNVAILTGREQGQGARILPDGPRRRLDPYPDRHPCDLPAEGRLQAARPRGDRRAAPLRRRPAADAGAEGGAAAAPAGDDRDADPAHPHAHPIWRDGREPARRDAAGPAAGRDAGGEPRPARRGDRRARPPYRRGQAGLLGLPAGRGERGLGPRRRRAAGAGAEAALRRPDRPRPRPDEGAGEGRGDGRLPARRPVGAGRDDGDRGRRRRAQRLADDRRGRGAVRPRPAPPAARPGRARRGAQRLPAAARADHERDGARAAGADARDQ